MASICPSHTFHIDLSYTFHTSAAETADQPQRNYQTMNTDTTPHHTEPHLPAEATPHLPSFPIPDLIPAEVAFETIGYFTPSSKTIKGITTKETTVLDTVRPDGTRLTLKICIVASGKYGLPMTSDLDYYRAFLKILDDTLAREGHITEPISLPTKTLLRYAGKAAGTAARREVKDWIRRSHATVIEGFFYLAEQGDYVEIGEEPLFPRYRLRGQQLDTGEVADSNYVWLASWFRSNYIHHHLRPIDLALHQRLRKPLSKSLLPLLEIGWYAAEGQPYTKSYHDLCHAFLLKEHRYLAHITRQLDPAHQELAQERVLAHWTYCHATKGRAWLITYYPGEKFAEEHHARATRRQRATHIAHRAQPLSPASPTRRDRMPPLLAEILAVCGDRQNQAAYQKVLREYPEGLVSMALAETRHAAQEARIRKNTGAYFMETVQQLARLRAADPETSQAETLPGEETVTATSTAAPARDDPPAAPASVARVQPHAATAVQEAAQTAAQEQRELEAAQAQTQARVAEVLAALAPEQRQALEERAKALVPLCEADFGYHITLHFTREDLASQEYLGFDRWPRLVEQVRACSPAAADDVLQSCRLEAILDDVLVVSVPTAAGKARLTERYLSLLEELARTAEPRCRLRVLTR